MSNNHISLLDFYETHLKLGPGEVILDVRNSDEFNEAHIEGALNIPVTELPQRFGELKDYKKIYIHCKRGGRAKTAFETLTQKGLDNLVCVHDAGMDLWIEKGFPVNKS